MIKRFEVSTFYWSYLIIFDETNCCIYMRRDDAATTKNCNFFLSEMRVTYVTQIVALIATAGLYTGMLPLNEPSHLRACTRLTIRVTSCMHAQIACLFRVFLQIHHTLFFSIFSRIFVKRFATGFTKRIFFISRWNPLLFITDKETDIKLIIILI